MKKFFPAILILAALTLSACGATTVKPATETTKKETTTKTESSKSLKDLLGLGTSQKCTYEVKVGEETVKGEIIVNGKKFKQTSEIINKDGSMKVYAISDGVYYYSWGDAMKGNGTKIKIEESETTAAPTGEAIQKQQGVSMDQKINYNCSPATLNDSDLAIPTDVKFLDYSEMMKNLQGGNLEELKKLMPSEE